MSVKLLIFRFVLQDVHKKVLRYIYLQNIGRVYAVRESIEIMESQVAKRICPSQSKVSKNFQPMWRCLNFEVFCRSMPPGPPNSFGPTAKI